jgi:methyl-accepting chemotaxis protein
MQKLLNRLRFPGSETIQSFIGRRILAAFSLIRTAILVTGIANVLLFQYLDAAEVQERNKTAEQGTLAHLSFVIDTQIQAYESAVWDTGKLPSTVSTARDLYTGEATSDLLALRRLQPALLAPNGALHNFVLSYLQLNDFWLALAPAIEGGTDRQPLQTMWQSRQALITTVPEMLGNYRGQVDQEQQQLQQAKANAKQGAIILSGIIGLISFALSIALAVVLTRQIVPPVIRLRDALQQVAEGNLSPQAAGPGRDEISQLLRTFNASVGRLRDLLLAVREQAQAISVESGRLKQAFAGNGLDQREAAALQDALAAAGQLAEATAGVTVLAGPEAPVGGADLQTAAPGVNDAAGTEIDWLAEQAAERARVLDELGRAVEQISVRLSAVTSRSDRLLSTVTTTSANGESDGAGQSGLADELQALDTDARTAVAQLEAIIQQVRSTQRMTTNSLASLDRAAGYLREAIAQFRLPG